MKITILIENENIENPELVSEHGLSLFIQKNGKKILFDTGDSGIFTENAHKLGIDISTADLAIISHGHYDHGGGLKAFFHENKTAPVILRKGAEEEYYAQRSESECIKAGLDQKLLKENSSRIRFVSKNTEIFKDFEIITDIKHKYPLPPGNKYLFEEVNGKLKPDRFQHELMVIILEGEKMSIITGCSHNGILNMIETAIDLYPEKEIKAVIGGFHMIGRLKTEKMGLSEGEVKYIGQKLMEYPIEKIYTGHCTGDHAYTLLKEIMGDKLDYCSTGTIIEL